jgi:hypothetical protein
MCQYVIESWWITPHEAKLLVPIFPYTYLVWTYLKKKKKKKKKVGGSNQMLTRVHLKEL